MKQIQRYAVALAWVMTSTFCPAASKEKLTANDELMIAALEGLLNVSEERSLPLVSKVLAGESDDRVKHRALFVLSQIEVTEAGELLFDFARRSEGSLKQEAIRMLGISGSPQALASLASLYANGDPQVRESVLYAYLIANDTDSVIAIAENAKDDGEFDSAVQTLGMMGASEALRSLRNRTGSIEVLTRAFAVSGDTKSLHELAKDDSNPERQVHAIRSLGIIGSREANEALLEIFRNTATKENKDAALSGLQIAGDEKTVIDLFRLSNDQAEKRKLLQTLSLMGGDAVLQIIDELLDAKE